MHHVIHPLGLHSAVVFVHPQNCSTVSSFGTFHLPRRKPHVLLIPSLPPTQATTNELLSLDRLSGTLPVNALVQAVVGCGSSKL